MSLDAIVISRLGRPLREVGQTGLRRDQVIQGIFFAYMTGSYD